MEDFELVRLLEDLERNRSSAGFLGVRELLSLASRGTVIYDPFSTLVSAEVVLGKGNVLWPGTILRCRGGAVIVGDGCEFGPGGVLVEAGAGERIEIGDRCRLSGGAVLRGTNRLGAGAQVLGALELRDCDLGAGEDHRHPDPDLRGGVIKGAGFAAGLVVGRGEVVNGRADLGGRPVERQKVYHPGPEASARGIEEPAVEPDLDGQSRRP